MTRRVDRELYLEEVLASSMFQQANILHMYCHDAFQCAYVVVNVLAIS